MNYGSESHNPAGLVFNCEYENQRDGAWLLWLKSKEKNNSKHRFKIIIKVELVWKQKK